MQKKPTILLSFVALFINVLVAYGQYSVVPQNANYPWCTEISSDLKLVASGQSNGSVILSDVKTGQSVNSFYGHSDAVTCVAFSEDNSYLISGTGNGDKSIILWDLNKGNKVKQFAGIHTSSVNDLVFIDNNRFVSSDVSGKVVLWDISSGKSLFTFDGGFPAQQWEVIAGIRTILSHKSSVIKVLYNKTSAQIISLTQNDVSWWNTSTGKRIANFKAPEKLSTMCLIPENKGVCVATTFGNLLYIDPSSFRLKKKSKQSTKEIKWVSYNEAGDMFCTVDENKKLEVKDLGSGKELYRINDFFDNAICVSKNMQYATNGLYTMNQMEIWNIPNNYQINGKNKERVNNTSSFVVSADGKYLITTETMKKEIQIWDLYNLTLKTTINNKLKKNVIFDVYPSSNPDCFYVVDNYLRIYEYSIKTSSKRRTHFGHEEMINDFSEFKNGTMAVSASKDKTVNIWNLTKTVPVNTINHKNEVRAAAVSADSKYVVFGGDDKNLVVWNLRTNTYVKKIFGHSSAICKIAFSPNNNLMVTSGEDNRLMVWQTGTWKLIKELKLDSYSSSMVFSNDSKKLFFNQIDSPIIYELDLVTYECSDKYSSNAGNIKQIVLNKNIIYSLQSDGSVRKWDALTNNWVAFLSGAHKNWAIYNQNYYWDGSPSCASMFAVSKGTTVYPIERIAVEYNRPDILIQQAQPSNTALLNAVKKQYNRRLIKAGNNQNHNLTNKALPNVKLLSQNVENQSLQLVFECSDNSSGLLSYQILVNGIPQFAKSGKPVSGISQIVVETLELPEGDNRVEINCMNMSGLQSFNELAFAKGGTAIKKDLYLISIGVSNYKNTNYNLAYAHKDALDFESEIKRMGGNEFTNVYTKSLVNEHVTTASVKACKGFLSNVKVNDMVIVFLAGHGKFDDKTGNYYYLTHNANLANLSATALNYKVIENLLNDIPNRYKIIFLDACESGEQIIKDKIHSGMLEASGIQSRGFKIKHNIKTNTQTKSTVKVNKNRYIFTDLFVRNGAVVFSSSGASELSYESEALKNGFFTHALLRALKGEADENNDGHIDISELKMFVSNLVSEMSNSMQNPTIDRDNIHQNFSIKNF